MRRIAFRRSFRLVSLLAWLRALLARWGFGWGRNLRIGESCRLTDSKLRVPLDAGPLEITLGNGAKKLHLYPEIRRNARGGAKRLRNFIIVDPYTDPDRIDGFLRLTPKSWLSLGRADANQQALYHYPPQVEDEHLVVIHGGDALIFRNLADSGVGIGPAFREQRWVPENRYRRLREIFGGPIAALPADQAMGLLQKVNTLMIDEAFRTRDARGLPGGLLQLPAQLTPIIVADLHAQIDNLLTVLSQNAFLDELFEGTAALIIIGDAVHCEIDGRLHEMAGSILMMDFIFRLKMRFPQQVFYLRGNHDSFSSEITKDSVPQGELWAEELRNQRGEAYLAAMREFYDRLPYVVVSADFVACHAAPPLTKVSADTVVNIHRHSELVGELIDNRPRRPERPQGYTRRHVKRFRRALQLDKNVPLIVGHTPIDNEHTLWLNSGGIDNHHVLYSADPQQVGVFTRVGGALVPLVYPVEPVSAFIARLPD